MRRTKFCGLPLIIISLSLLLTTFCGSCARSKTVSEADLLISDVSEEGTKISARMNRAFTVSGGGTESVLSFEYKLLGEGLIDVALINDDWGSNYFGYYYFNEKGALGNYSGIKTEKTEEGYIRVVFNISDLKVFFGERKPEAVKVVFMRLTNSDSDVLIRNRQ